MRVFLSAGEASGDAYAGALVLEMGRLGLVGPEGFEGVGGSRLRAAAARVHEETSSWGAIGIAQAALVAPQVWAGVRRVRRALGGAPGLFIPIDFGFVNIRLARFAKSRGWRVLYFVPPGSWRRDRQGVDLPAVADEIVTPFPWSAEILRSMGARAHWFGHPLKQLMRASGEGPGAVERRGVAVLPGSRGHELEQNLPVIAAALAGSAGTWRGAPTPGVCHERLEAAVAPIRELVEFAVAPSVDLEALKRRWAALAPERGRDRFTVGDAHGVLRRARAAIVCSGTATLEAALCGCPTVVVYRASAGMALQARLAGFRPRFVSLPNLLLDRPALPEFVGREVSPGAVGGALARLLEDGPERRSQLEAFEEIDRLTGPDDAITRTAELAIRMMRAG